jgi:PAS domain S-box-containing protein
VGSGFHFHALPEERSATERALAVATCLTFALVLRSLLAPWLEPGGAYAFLLPAICASAWFSGPRWGAAAAAVAVFLIHAQLGLATIWQTSHEIARITLFCANGAILVILCTAWQQGLRRTRRARNEAARQFEIMANNAPVLIWTTDQDGRCVFVNRHWRTFTGRQLESDGLRPGRVHPSDAPRYEAVSAEAIAARKAFRIEYRLLRNDDEYRWLEEQAVPRLDDRGRFEGYTGSCNDITDARSEREELSYVGRIQSALTESLDVDVCADVVTRALVPRLADWCRLQLTDESGEFEYARATHFETISDPRWPVPAPERAHPASARVRAIIETGDIQQGEADDALRREIAQSPDHYERLRSIRSLRYLGVPLRARGRIVGTLEIAMAETGRPLGEDVTRLLKKIAATTGFAMENARLYRSICRAHRAEAEARREVERSEQRFRFVWDANVFGVGTIDSDGRLRTSNEVLATLLGFDANTLALGRANLNERTPPEWRAVNRQAADEIARTGRCSPYETEFLRADGTTAQVLVAGSALPDSPERILFVLDLSARKQAERALDRQRLLLRTIVDSMPAMVGYLDTDLRFKLHNERWRKWLGREASAINGRTAREVFGSEAYPQIQPYLEAALRGRTIRHETTLHTTVRARHLIATYRADRDENDEIVGVVVHAYDITERKEVEQALADALSRYRFLADAMPQMIWTADPEGRLDYVNRRWLETTGMTELAALEPDGWLGAVHFEDREETRAQWHRALVETTPFEHECRIRCGKNVSWRWHLVRALPRRDAGLEVAQWVGSATDVDEQRRAFAELEHARQRLKDHAEELEQRVRARTETLREANAELEAFTYSVSHDLRTPLQFIRGFAEAIQSSGALAGSSENAEHLSRIIRAAARMDATIGDLLAYSRLTQSEIQLEPLRLETAVTDVLAQHHAAIKRTGATVFVDRPLPAVCADRTGLTQALANLISNALKFTRPGEAPWIRIRAETDERAVRLWVEDRGIGIEAADQDRIFRLFERLHGHSDYPGTGVGLSLVRKAVTRMGGTCGVVSSPGQGSRFWLEFPTACNVPNLPSPSNGDSAVAPRIGPIPEVN